MEREKPAKGLQEEGEPGERALGRGTPGWLPHCSSRGGAAACEDDWGSGHRTLCLGLPGKGRGEPRVCCPESCPLGRAAPLGVTRPGGLPGGGGDPGRPKA